MLTISPTSSQYAEVLEHIRTLQRLVDNANDPEVAADLDAIVEFLTQAYGIPAHVAACLN
jgi:hypothetical protein